jgi:hypothetical protein
MRRRLENGVGKNKEVLMRTSQKSSSTKEDPRYTKAWKLSDLLRRSEANHS